METDDDLKIKNIFGRKKEQVFKKFADFHIVLSALSQISKKLERKIEVPKFDTISRERKSVPSVEDEEAFKAIYDEQPENTNEAEFYGAVYNETEERKEGSELDQAIDEMINFNETFITKVLEHIKTNFEAKAVSQLLRREFFPVFRTDELLKLHLKLRHHFQKVQYSYVEIGQVFDDLKDDFLVYCEILAKMKTVMEFFADQMTENEEVSSCIKRLQREASKSEVVQMDPRVTCELRDLMVMVPQHVMRYHMILSEIQKQAFKAQKTEVAKEAERAQQIMSSLTQHIERVSTDHKYIQAMKEFRKEIRNLKIDDLHRFGVLQCEKQYVLLSHGQSKLLFQPFHLLIFSEHIIALQKMTKEEFTGKTDFFGRPIRIKKELKCFSKFFQLKLVDSVIKRQVDDQTFHVWVNTYTDALVDFEKTFVLSFKSAEAASETEALLKKTVANCQRAVKLRKIHAGHNYRKLRGGGSLSESCRARCADPQCRQLLLGLLFTGVECLTCNKIYHTECISEEADNLPARQEYFEDPNNPNIVKPDDLTIEDMSLGDASRQEAARALKGRRPGTFLLRYSKTNYSPMLAVKTFETEDNKKVHHLEINKVEIHGTEFLYLERGVCAGSILELISMHRTTHKLYTPIHIQEEGVISEESVKMEETFLRSTDSVQSDQFHPGIQGPGEAEKGHASFFHGDITAVEASNKLKDEEPGSFLLRGTEDALKLTWKRQNGKVIHASVKKEGNRYSLVSKKTFPTIEEMVSFYQNIERDHKLALGQPLHQEDGGLLEAQDQHSDLQKPETNISTEEQLTQLPYYRGVMSEGEIATTLQSQPDSVFLLARDPDLDNVFISYRKNQRTLHLKIEQDNNLGFGVETWEMGRVTATSISGLVLALQTEGVLLEPFSQSVSQHARGLWQSSVKGMNVLTQWQASPGSGTEYDTDDSEVSRVTQDSQRRRSTLEKVESKENYENTLFGLDDHDIPPFPVWGQMTKRDAEKVLFGQPDNTWVLRYNNLSQETISVKRAERVIHMKLYHSEGGVSLQEHRQPKPLDSLIRELQQNGKLGEQLTKERN